MKERIFRKALDEGRFKKASRVLKDLKKEIPRKDALYLEGLYLEKSGDLDEALKKYDMALVLHLSDPSLWLAKARVLIGQSRMEMARRASDRACRLADDDPEPHLVHAEILYRTKEYQQAMEHIDIAIEKGANSAEALTLKGILISILDQNFREALMFFDSAIESNDGYSRAWTNRGIALRQIGDRDGAIYSFRRALMIDSGDRNARKMLQKMGREDLIEEPEDEEEEEFLEWE